MICLLATRPTGMMKERVGKPSIKTVQAPHSPSPQPYLLPVRSRSLRSTPSRLAVESTSTCNFLPLILSAVTFDISAASDSNFFQERDVSIHPVKGKRNGVVSGQ